MNNIFVILLFAVLAIVNARHVVDYQENELWMNANGNNRRIVRGESANIADFPHMLAILNLALPRMICGASVIHRFWALTAAHCIARVTPARLINFRGGSTSRLNGGFIFRMENFIQHPNYNLLRVRFDVGLARISNETPLEGLHVRPIALPQPCPRICCGVCAGVIVRVSGWGDLGNGQSPENLMQLRAPVHEHGKCVELWRLRNSTAINEEYFCKSVVDGRDTCGGDSGSPLFTEISGNRIQVGAVSFGERNCGEGYLPSGNVRLEHPNIRNWIRSTAGI